jgi:hypothetical protein
MRDGRAPNQWRSVVQVSLRRYRIANRLAKGVDLIVIAFARVRIEYGKWRRNDSASRLTD